MPVTGVEIDPRTDLPMLPENMFWRVKNMGWAVNDRIQIRKRVWFFSVVVREFSIRESFTRQATRQQVFDTAVKAYHAFNEPAYGPYGDYPPKSNKVVR